MHYGDDKQLENSILQIVVYTHDYYDGDADTNGKDLQITSIQKCQYVTPATIAKILNTGKSKSYEKHQAWLLAKFSELDKLELERWWLVTFKEIDGELGNNIIITDIVDVSDSTNQFARLH